MGTGGVSGNEAARRPFQTQGPAAPGAPTVGGSPPGAAPAAGPAGPAAPADRFGQATGGGPALTGGGPSANRPQRSAGTRRTPPARPQPQAETPAPAGYRYIRGGNDPFHTQLGAQALRDEVTAGRGDQAMNALTYPRDPNNPVLAPNQNRMDHSDRAEELAAGFTRPELNGVVQDVLRQEFGAIADPRTASALVHAAATNPALMQRITTEGTQQTKRDVAHAVLADPTLSADAKTRMLGELTQASGRRNDPDNLSLDQVLSSAPDASLHGLSEMMARPMSPNIAETVARNTTPATQLRVSRAILQDEALSPQQRTNALREVMTHTSREGLNHLLGNANADERGAFAAVIAGSVPLAERVGRDLTPQNQQRVVDETLRLPLPRSSTGRLLSVMMHPANMSPAHKNQLVDHLQNSGQLPALLETQVYMPVHQSLLPGLTAENAAAVNRGFQSLAREAASDPRVADPDAIGRSVSASEAANFQRSVSRTTGTSNTNTQTSTHTVGASVTAKGKIGIPFVAEGEVSATGSYSYANASSTSRTRSSSDTRSAQEGYTQSHSSNLNLDARQSYGRDVNRWQESNAFTRASEQVDGWSQNQSQQYRTAYRRERGEIHR
jgi:hypothetical protein